jgi:hypothetical protein
MQKGDGRMLNSIRIQQSEYSVFSVGDHPYMRAPLRDLRVSVVNTSICADGRNI